MNLMDKYLKKMPAPAEAMPLIKAALIKPTDTPQAAATDLFNISETSSEHVKSRPKSDLTATDLFNLSIPFIETSRAKPTETSTPPAPDTDLLNLPVSSWLEKLSDDERDTYQERAAIMEYDGGLPREQAEIEAIKRIIQERIIRGKCDICQRVAGCMLTPKQRALCQVK